jgi:hypothetical protein
MDKDELLERYEAIGEESDFLAAKPLFERDVRGQPDPILLRQYGYLLECHGRYTIRRAVEQYERAIALDPDADKVQYQWIGAKASVGEQEPSAELLRRARTSSMSSTANMMRCMPQTFTPFTLGYRR